jgi:hypothetical protein
MDHQRCLVVLWASLAMLLVANPRTPAQDLANVVSATNVEHNPVKVRASLAQNRILFERYA